jgi:hypothetical protein
MPGDKREPPSPSKKKQSNNQTSNDQANSRMKKIEEEWDTGLKDDLPGSGEFNTIDHTIAPLE